jgi:hypothetical protein
MFFSSEREALNVALDGARAIFDTSGAKPKVLSAQNVSTFWRELGYSFKLILDEKEILFFAALQWLVIALAYVLWTKVLDWIPDQVWDEVAKSGDDRISFTLLNLALLGWSFLVVTVASYPIAILNAAMTATHYLRSAGQSSSIARCFNLAFKHLGRLWVFTTIDAWITVNAILDRLPRKRGRRTAFDELLYYAWKIGTIGVVPALVAGKGYIEAAKDSVSLLKNQPVRTIGIRMGFSLICWIIGIAAYVGGAFYMMGAHGPARRANDVYNFYLLMAVPIVIAVGVTAVVVRPFYLVMVSKLYTDVVPVDRDAIVPMSGKKFDVLAVIFATLLFILLAFYFFGEQLGIVAWIESLAARDLQAHQLRQSQ